MLMLALLFQTMQAPSGLGASALADTSFRWIPRSAPGFRVYFAADSYPARHQDSLIALLPPALLHARGLVHAPEHPAPIDVFFIESRQQMARLTGAPVTGFAHVAAGAVFLVTNPEWRAFERHEIMHVVVGQMWGRPDASAAWLQEGIAQAADGRCAGADNARVAAALAERHGWIPLDSVLHAFRRQADLRAYLQAAAFTRYLMDGGGLADLRRLWREGATARSRVRGMTLARHEAAWKRTLPRDHGIGADILNRIEDHGCG